MKINWKVRFQNKIWLGTFITAVLSFVYMLLGLCNVVPSVSKSVVVDLVMALIDLFVLLGIVVDPTTEGTSDSKRALGYEKLGGGEDGQ